MVNAGLSLLVAAVKITVKDVVVKDCSEPDADAVGHVQKLIPPQVSQRAQGSKDSEPLPHSKRISAQYLVVSAGIYV